MHTVDECCRSGQKLLATSLFASVSRQFLWSAVPLDDDDHEYRFHIPTSFSNRDCSSRIVRVNRVLASTELKSIQNSILECPVNLRPANLSQYYITSCKNKFKADPHRLLLSLFLLLRAKNTFFSLFLKSHLLHSKMHTTSVVAKTLLDKIVIFFFGLFTIVVTFVFICVYIHIYMNL